MSFRGRNRLSQHRCLILVLVLHPAMGKRKRSALQLAQLENATRERVEKHARKHVEDAALISGETSRAVARQASNAGTGALTAYVQRQSLSMLQKEVKRQKVCRALQSVQPIVHVLTNRPGEWP
jgi:hypothetical protein